MNTIVTDNKPTAGTTQSKSHSPAIDFFEKRHRLKIQYLNPATLVEPAQAVKNSDRQYSLFLGSSAAAEQALYWLISAPALGYLIYLAVSLSGDQ